MYSSVIPPDYLHDESRLTGNAQTIAFPRTTEEVQCAIREAAGKPVSVQGARTGISGGAVPDGGVIISLARMTKIVSPVTLHSDGRYTVIVQPGVLLSELRDFLKSESRQAEACTTNTSSIQRSTCDTLNPEYSSAYASAHKSRNPDPRHCSCGDSPSPASHPAPRIPNPAEYDPCIHPSSFIPHPSLIFPPDPTESSASIGGMTACNASGACSFAYGSTRRHVNRVTVVLADGDTVTLKRGEISACNRDFSLTTGQGRLISGRLPPYTAPDVKNAAGYAIAPGMDLLDLFIGSEGSLGIITEIELLLSPAPLNIAGIICFFSSESSAVEFVTKIRMRRSSVNARLNAIEYFDSGALHLIKASGSGTGLKIPALESHWVCAVYLEWAIDKDNDCRHFDVTGEILSECGSTMEDTWLSMNTPGMERMKAFRHCVPEQVNAIISDRKKIHPGLTKLGTDLSVPDNRLTDVMQLYRKDLQTAGLEYVIFGHIGNNHVHVNIIPRNMEDYETGKKLYHNWAAQVVQWGGSVSAEHGIGRLKKEMLAVMYGKEHIEEMKQLKGLFDPEMRLNPGRLF